MTDGQCHRKERIKATCKTDLILSTTSTGCILFKKFLTDASFVQRMQLYISSSRSLSLSVSVPLSLCISHHKPMPPPPSPSLFHHLFRSGINTPSIRPNPPPFRLSVSLSVGRYGLPVSFITCLCSGIDTPSTLPCPPDRQRAPSTMLATVCDAARRQTRSTHSRISTAGTSPAPSLLDESRRGIAESRRGKLLSTPPTRRASASSTLPLVV